MIYLLALIAGIQALILAVVCRMYEHIVRATQSPSEPSTEPAEGGMNLNLLNPNKPKAHKARRFTDRSREWLLASERSSRR